MRPAEALDDLAMLEDADLDLLLLIRHFELTVLDLFAQGRISGTTHTCLGQEYIPVAMTQLLMPAFVVSNHRGHGHYLAQFGDPVGLLAEIAGRSGGICGGLGGSQHLYRDGFCSTGVQGEGVPIALGVALHLSRVRRSGLAVAYLGDGTWGQGVLYEALNMAQLWSAPLVLLVENNGIAQSTPAVSAMAGSVAGRAAAFGVRYEEVTATCPLAIRRQLADPVQRTRDAGGPLIVEFRTSRLGPHSKGDDTRGKAELAAIAERDWYIRYRQRYREQFETADATQRHRMTTVAAEVLARPPATGTAA